MDTTVELENFKQELKRPSVFDFVNYRDFLQRSYNYLNSMNPSFSETAFIKKAGYGANSRGYFKLIVSGKRNLSSATILGFGQALKLSVKELEYFENLVLFNQGKNQKDKAYYFEKLSSKIKGKETEAYKLLKSQYNYLSKWYLIAIRELVSLKDFQHNADWISRKLRGEVTPNQVREAIEDLLKLGLLKEDEKRGLVQVDSLLHFSDNSLNYTVVNNIHSQMLQRTNDLLDKDDYALRSASSVTLSCRKDDFSKIREEIATFREHILNKYGTNTDNLDTVLHLGVQLVHLTEPVKSRGE